MPEVGIAAKVFIEGAPRRNCPILLRQTSFKALEEPVSFALSDGGWRHGAHTARFGEVEQRGVALTPSGRALYDSLLESVRCAAPGASNPSEYVVALERAFRAFPDDWDEIRSRKLGYFTYALTEKGRRLGIQHTADVEELVTGGYVACSPMTYEDFLPVSAAGIFRSNLGDEREQKLAIAPSRLAFEDALGAAVLDEFALYAELERASLEQCRSALAGNARSPQAVTGA